MSDRPGPLPESPAPPAPAQTAEPVEISEVPFALTEPSDEPEEDKQPRSRTKTIVLGSLLAVTLAGLGAIGYAGWGIAREKDATLTTPDKIGNLTMDTSEQGRSTADYLQTALSAEVDLDHAVGAVYSDAGGNNVLFFGGTTLIWTPGSDLETAFELISDNQGAVTGLHDVPAGKLGGTMKCGTTKTDDANMSVCGWADHGSLALAMFPGRTESDAAALLQQIRDTAQTRN
ncbi:hypothetical protein [Actinoplanes sp. N902-109]|uniref:hypothetical protein n=1 Tax=Actinoplanes sp. (strain N902-109) TaxID=649831 RepID=UPI000329359F|nr:hypothetical protein [Actinoplanes sp. N902-109]AGL15015.1 hypothetical protein L083_1505 [Actinoplanes sp. N902-109]